MPECLRQQRRPSARTGRRATNSKCDERNCAEGASALSAFLSSHPAHPEALPQTVSKKKSVTGFGRHPASVAKVCGSGNGSCVYVFYDSQFFRMYGLPIRGVPEEAGKWWAFRLCRSRAGFCMKRGCFLPPVERVRSLFFRYVSKNERRGFTLFF